jgi:hypothetical protein
MVKGHICRDAYNIVFSLEGDATVLTDCKAQASKSVIDPNPDVIPPQPKMAGYLGSNLETAVKL